MVRFDPAGGPASPAAWPELRSRRSVEGREVDRDSPGDQAAQQLQHGRQRIAVGQADAEVR